VPAPAIVGRGLGKRFVSHRSRATSLKELALRQKQSSEDFWALRDVSVEVGHGETVGLIGANGSGKSTLLKVLAGILQPTMGSVTVNGRVASLLELGAGFNGELSGRDNVYLNASLLGLRRREVDALFDDIVAFSELEEFIDNAVKHYSSGMYVRLGFAVAVHIDPDILLVDEVLAVGDEAFQAKCLAKIAEFQEQGRTILFVSHALGLVEEICSRAIVLNHGRVAFDGPAAYATGTLRGLLFSGGELAAAAREDDGLRLQEITVSHQIGAEPVESFSPGEPFAVRIPVEVPAGLEVGRLEVTAVVMGAGDIPIFAMRATDADAVPGDEGRWNVDFTVPSMPALRGGFVIAVSLDDPVSGMTVAAVRFDQHYFTVAGTHPVGIFGVPFTARTAPATAALGRERPAPDGAR
jgi:ABC-2 type transport system ATP-binding protein